MRGKINNIFKPLSFILAISFAVSVGYIVKEQLSKKKEFIGITHVYSHRGASGEEIEHTFAAYDLAIEYGSKYIEQDLVTSQNNTLFVSHDLSAKRITGVEKQFHHMTDSEIRQLKTKNGENIHSLSEVFERYEDSIIYVIELKQNESQIQLFEEVVSKYHLEDNVIVQASTEKTLEDISKKFPKMQKLLLIKKQEDLDKFIDSPVVDIFGCDKKFMTKSNVDAIHNSNKKANFWTLNTTEEIKTAIALDVDSYFTNFTGKALLIEEKNRSKY